MAVSETFDIFNVFQSKIIWIW